MTKLQKKSIAGCELILRALSSLRRRIQSGDMATYTQIVPRGMAVDAEKRRESYETVDKDVSRSALTVNEEAVKDNKACREQIRNILAELEDSSLYYQGMADICAPIVYAGVALDISEEDTKENCYTLLESYTLPLLQNNMQEYIKHEKVLRSLPGYKTKYPEIKQEEISEMCIETDAILLWYTRYFEFDEVAQIFAYLMESAACTQFLFFLPAMREIREKQKPDRTQRSTKRDRERIKEYIEATKKLEKQYGKEFTRKSSNTLLVFAALSVSVAAVAGLCMLLDRKQK